MGFDKTMEIDTQSSTQLNASSIERCKLVLINTYFTYFTRINRQEIIGLLLLRSLKAVVLNAHGLLAEKMVKITGSDVIAPGSRADEPTTFERLRESLEKLGQQISSGYK